MVGRPPRAVCSIAVTAGIFITKAMNRPLAAFGRGRGGVALVNQIKSAPFALPIDTPETGIVYSRLHLSGGIIS